MLKSKVFRIFLLIIALVLTALPFYLLRSYLVLGYKFLYPDYSRLKSNQKVTSILLLGKGGEGHTAPDLTDTLIDIFASQKSKRISLLPIPRDIWIPEIRAKVNSAYYWDKQRQNSDFELTKLAVGGITGVTPDYVVVVDFSMFKDLVDALGGIEVVVDNSFVDEKFPILGKEEDLCDGDKTYACRYETIGFEKGEQTMDGETALKFVRSRNAQGDEGTDLARETRQQKIIGILKNAIFSMDLVTDPNRAFSVLDSALTNIETNLDIEAAVVLARVLFDSKDNVENLSIPEEFLVISNKSARYDYQYVFLPMGGKWEIFSTTLRGQIY